MDSAPGKHRSGVIARLASVARIVLAVLLVVISLTGIFLNHRDAVGLTRPVESLRPEMFTNALPLAELAIRARAVAGPEIGNFPIERMDVRPSDSFVKVRFADKLVTEVTLNVYTGEVLDVGSRNDVLVGSIHSGELLGRWGVVVSDAVAVSVVLGVIWIGVRRRRAFSE